VRGADLCLPGVDACVYLRVPQGKVKDVVARLENVGLEQATPVIVNRLLPIDGIEDTRTLVAIAFPEPDEEDRDRYSAWS
jgi:hypothetical protein